MARPAQYANPSTQLESATRGERETPKAVSPSATTPMPAEPSIALRPPVKTFTG